MSTSPSLAPSREARAGSASALIQPFPYDTVPSGAHPQRPVEDPSALSAVPTDSDTVAREARARAQGRQEAEAQAQQSFRLHLEKERASIATALAGFTRDRAAYFQKVESEVVQLALSIARKILHREAQLDPLLLAGIVRVALEKIDGATGVVLHVHPSNAADWRRFLSLHLNPADLPEILEDSSQDPDSCTLETAMGTAVMGLDIQLNEIELGLMDLIAARPGGTVES